MSLDLLQARVKMRDRSVADVLDLALRFVAVHGKVYARVAAASLLPFAGVALAFGKVFGWGLAWIVAVPLAVMVEVPFTVLASRLVFEERVSAREVLSASLRAAPRVLFVRALGALVTVLGLALLLAPGVWLAAIFLFLGEVMLLERASIGQAFSRAQRVAGSEVSEVVIGVLVFALVPLISVVLADFAGRALIGELLQFRPPRPFWAEGGSALATIGLFVQVPYLATARFFLYLNVRTRTEGWDIQTRFAALAARAEDPT